MKLVVKANVVISALIPKLTKIELIVTLDPDLSTLQFAQGEHEKCLLAQRT